MTIMTQPLKISDTIVPFIAVLMMHGKDSFVGNTASPAFLNNTGPYQ